MANFYISKQGSTITGWAWFAAEDVPVDGQTWVQLDGDSSDLTPAELNSTFVLDDLVEVIDNRLVKK